MVTVRSARLIAAAVCGILLHLHRDQPLPEGGAPPRTCVAVDGGIFVRYGFYRELLKQGVRDIFGDAVADQVCSKILLKLHTSLSLTQSERTRRISATSSAWSEHGPIASGY